MTPAFIVKEDLVGKVVLVCDSLKRPRYRGRVRAIARNSEQFHLLIEVTEKLPDEDRELHVGELVTSAIPSEWESVVL